MQIWGYFYTEKFPCCVTKLQQFANDNVHVHVPENIHFKTTDQVASYIRTLDPSNATGLDGRDPRIINLAANSLYPHIAALINKSIISGIFPSELKCNKIFPVFKVGSKSNPSIYRPSSILSTVPKIFEQVAQGGNSRSSEEH